jgi:hypothetical protein
MNLYLDCRSICEVLNHFDCYCLLVTSQHRYMDRGFSFEEEFVALAD